MKMGDLKRAVAERVYRYLYYWSVAVHSTSSATVLRLRNLGVKIGSEVAIYDSCFDPLYPELITIGSRVTITHAVILTHDDSAVLGIGRRRAAPVVIGDGVFIGWNAIILPGVVIGNDCVIGAGSVVTKSVPDNSVMAGNPAKFLKHTSDYYARCSTDPHQIPVNFPNNLFSEHHELEARLHVQREYFRS